MNTKILWFYGGCPVIGINRDFQSATPADSSAAVEIFCIEAEWCFLDQQELENVLVNYVEFYNSKRWRCKLRNLYPDDHEHRFGFKRIQKRVQRFDNPVPIGRERKN